jgi:hypothetical protein
MGRFFEEHETLLLGAVAPATDGKGYRTLFVKSHG